MKYFATSVFEHIRRQMERAGGEVGSQSKLLFMLPSLPPAAVLEIGDQLSAFCVQNPQYALPVIKVAAPLFEKWNEAVDAALLESAATIRQRGWNDDQAAMTRHRHQQSAAAGTRAVVLLIGTDVITDSSSLEDFHHCDLRTIWQQELKDTFAAWVQAALTGASVGYDDDTVEHFDWVLKPLIDRGLADILQISTLLQKLDWRGAQDGRDAERILLEGLACFGLPRFSGFRFTSPKALGGYLDHALAFFSYDAFIDPTQRKKKLETIHRFEQDNPPGEMFDPDQRGSFGSDQEFLNGLRRYIASDEQEARKRLFDCDFVTIHDRVLKYKPPKEEPDPDKEKKETVRKLTGGPVEMALNALWLTLGEFKRAAQKNGILAHVALLSIDIESTKYKHSCDGDSPEEIQAKGFQELSRLLGGVDAFLAQWIDTAEFRPDGSPVEIQSRLVRPGLICPSARTAEPQLEFSVTISAEGLTNVVTKRFAWRLPEIHPYRVADALIHWAAKSVKQAPGHCLPVYHVPYYEELMLARDDEETRRVLLHCVQDESDGLDNLLRAHGLDNTDPLLPRVRNLASVYDHFLKRANEDGLHRAMLENWQDLRKACEQAGGGFLSDEACRNTQLAPFLFRAFLIIQRRSQAEADRWMWSDHEPSCVVTVLHPALLEMLRAQLDYLLAAFSHLAAQELRAPGPRSFRELLWQGFVDLAGIQMPICGLLKDPSRNLDTDVRGEGLIHRVGSTSASDAPLTTRLLLRYDAFEDEDISDSELFRQSRESLLISRILDEYRRLHPHAEDGLSIAIYQNDDIQPVVAAIDEYLRTVCDDRPESARDYAMSVTVFTESSDDASVSRWVTQWKDRWEAAEGQTSLGHYRRTRLSLSHRIVSPARNYQQFVELIEGGLEVDIAMLHGFIRAGSQGNDFEEVGAYDVRTQTLKFPILEKSFCASKDPALRLQRARVLSNRQFVLSTGHAEIMARFKRRGAPLNTHHVVLGFGDYTPWQGVVDALHRRAEWVVCIDPNIDERLIAEKSRETQERREIIGFGSGVGPHGEANYTISTEHFQLGDVLHKLAAAIQELYFEWDSETYQKVAQSVLKESQHLSGLSLVRATGVGEYIRDFMAYSLTRKLVRADDQVLCDQIVSLDAYRHWFDSAESQTRPDLLWMVARIDAQGRLNLDLRLIECKLAKVSDAHLDKAREQLENGLHHLPQVFKPRGDGLGGENERPDQRYWWLQLHRLIASKAEVTKQEEWRVLTALERLAEGDFDVTWRAAALTFWTDDRSNKLTRAADWACAFDGREIGITVLSVGSEFVRTLCAGDRTSELPWSDACLPFAAARPAAKQELHGELADLAADDSDEQELSPSRLESGTSDSRAEPDGQKPSVTPITVKIPDRILLGVSSPGSRKVYWEFGHKDLSNRHMLIFGSSGTGKTYTIECLLSELGNSGQNSLILDYTNGFFDNQLEPEFKKQLSPLQHVVRREPLAINPFRQQVDVIGDDVYPESPSTTAQRVSGVFSGVYNFGDQQYSALYQAVKTRLEQAGAGGMTLEDLIPRLEAIGEDKGTQGQAAGSVISKLRPFLDQNPFGAEDPESWDRLFTDREHRCHVIQLAGFMKDAARLVTEFSLIDLYWFYRASGTQARPRVVVLDEVQNLDHREDSPLAQLLREGRKFGFALILATQIMSNLDRDERDRLFLAGHKLFFHPAETEVRAYAEIAAVSTGEKADTWVTRLAGLKKGECYSLGPSLNEATGKLETKAFKIRVTSMEERSGHGEDS
jgi:DNA phosphorothioation-dependent restriction protein DptH